MTAADEVDELARRANQLYAARTALAEAEPNAVRFGVAEIMQFLSDPGRSLSMEEQKLLFANRRLRTDYRRLKALHSVAELPALAAASTGRLETRRFDQGSVRIHLSRVAGQVYVVVRFDSPTSSARVMLLEHPSGEILKRALPAPGPEGEAMLVLDSRNADDQTFLRLLSDPTTTGALLP
jgi:hypothetical protein